MARLRILALLLLGLAVPAAAQSFGFSIGAFAPHGCVAIGPTLYRAEIGHADVSVRLDRDATSPDLRIEFAGTADEADFVFVDDGAAAPRCEQGRTVRRVKIDPAAADMVVGFATAAAPADYRLYVRSQWLAPDTAAALFAASHMPRRKLAGNATIR